MPVPSCKTSWICQELRCRPRQQTTKSWRSRRELLTRSWCAILTDEEHIAHDRSFATRTGDAGSCACCYIIALICWCVDESPVSEALAQTSAAQSMEAGHALRNQLHTCLLRHSSSCMCCLMLRPRDPLQLGTAVHKHDCMHNVQGCNAGSVWQSTAPMLAWKPPVTKCASCCLPCGSYF